MTPEQQLTIRAELARATVVARRSAPPHFPPVQSPAQGPLGLWPFVAGCAEGLGVLVAFEGEERCLT